MENKLTKEIRVLSSLCDAQGRMGVFNIFNAFMDMAAEHADRIGVGFYAMLDKGAFWVAVRTRVRFYDRPALMDVIGGETWPAAPALAKNDRFYRLSRGGKILAEGRTEWAAQSVETGRILRCAEYFPGNISFLEEQVCPEAFTRFRPLAGDGETFFYTVAAMDIDTGHHMNNAMYIRMLLNTFSVAEQQSMDMTEMEISYRRACREGENLSICRQFRENAWWFDVIKPDGEIAAQALLRVK